MAHTSGPWVIEDVDDLTEYSEIAIVSAGGQHVCAVSSADTFTCLDDDEWDEMHEEAVANANLIAAAPDLLAACEAIMAADERDIPAIVQAIHLVSAAIAKAKGGAS